MKGIIFSRVSSTTDRQNLAYQVDKLKRVAEEKQIEIVRIFEEKISGAKKNAEREILQESLSFCVAEEIDIILVSELSRLGRSVWELLKNVEFCISHSINIYFLKEDKSILNKNGKPNPFIPIIMAVLGTCAEIERESIYFRLQTGREKYILEGGKLGRKPNKERSEEEVAQTNEKEKKRIEKKYADLIKNLKTYPIRVAIKLSPMIGANGESKYVSLSTAQKIKKLFNIVRK